MGIEIDMLSVGNADAIALRWVNGDGSNFVAVIDGGYQDDGLKLVNIVQSCYRRSYIDLVVSTHPDQDHIGGLTLLVKNMKVSRVWVHDPSRRRFAESFRHARMQFGFRAEATMLMKSMDDVSEFIRVVDGYRIPRDEPFTGMRYGPMQVLGPSIDFYEQMLAELAVEEGIVSEARLFQEQEYLSDYVLESEPRYAIDENDETSPVNNMSTVIGLNDNGRVYLFTGDAGVQALEDCRTRYRFEDIYWLDVPHHGSRRNLSSALVEYLNPQVAYVSAQGDRKHPSRAVVNALKRVGTRVYSTHKGGSKWHHNGDDVPDGRPGYSTAEPL